MTSPLRSAIRGAAIMGGAATLALCCAPMAAASEASMTIASTADGPQVQRIMVVGASDDRGGFGGDNGPGMGRRGRDPERMAKHLRDVLQLTPTQEPALQAFLAAMHPPHQGSEPPGPGGEHAYERSERGQMTADPAARKAEMDRRMAEMEKKRAEEAALTTPQRLDMMVAKMAERTAMRQAEMRAHVAAIKQFYGALTPTQQKAFDALHGGMWGGRGHEPGARMRRMGMMMDGPAPPWAPLPPIPPLAMRALRSPTPPLPPERPPPQY